MNPDDTVLVALINNPRDLELVEHEHWYRIPVRHAPRFFDGAEYVAFYLSRAFGERKWSICQYARVKGHELFRRRDLLPDEETHPRADELYYKLEVGSLQERTPPITSRRGRRVLFLWTDWRRFSKATEINDLFVSSPGQDRLWEVLKTPELDVERQVAVHDASGHYRVDFMLYCPRGRLGILIEDFPRHLHPDRFRALRFRTRDLEEHFERTVKRIKNQAREMGFHYCTKEAQK